MKGQQLTICFGLVIVAVNVIAFYWWYREVVTATGVFSDSAAAWMQAFLTVDAFLAAIFIDELRRAKDARESQLEQRFQASIQAALLYPKIAKTRDHAIRFLNRTMGFNYMMFEREQYPSWFAKTKENEYLVNQWEVDFLSKYPCPAIEIPLKDMKRLGAVPGKAILSLNIKLDAVKVAKQQAERTALALRHQNKSWNSAELKKDIEKLLEASRAALEAARIAEYQLNSQRNVSI